MGNTNNFNTYAIKLKKKILLQKCTKYITKYISITIIFKGVKSIYNFVIF